MVEYSTDAHKTCVSFLDTDEAHVLLGAMDEVQFFKSSDLFQRDELADGVYFILSGKVAVKSKTGFGDREQVIALLGPGSVVGEIGLLPGKKRGASAVVVDNSSFLLLKKEKFDQVTQINPHLALKVLQYLLSKSSLRLRKSSERLAHVL